MGAATLDAKEAKAKLDGMLSEREEKRAESVVTLEQLLGEPIPLGTLWPGAAYQSPKMKDLKAILQGMASLQNRGLSEELSDQIAALDELAGMAQRLLVVQSGEGWRKPTIDEIEERFEVQELQVALMRMLQKDGFGEYQGNAGGGPTTGATDTGPSEIGSPV